VIVEGGGGGNGGDGGGTEGFDTEDEEGVFGAVKCNMDSRKGVFLGSSNVTYFYSFRSQTLFGVF